jgi:hypothetical protein
MTYRKSTRSLRPSLGTSLTPRYISWLLFPLGFHSNPGLPMLPESTRGLQVEQ